MDEAGFETAHIVGNSLGGYVALQLAARGRAESVVALAPAGGWADGDESFKEHARPTSPRCRSCSSRRRRTPTRSSPPPEGRRRATQFTATNYEHIPAELLAHQIRGAASCAGRLRADRATRERNGWTLDAERIACPVRVVWGTEDKILRLAVRRRPLPRRLAAARRLGRARRHRPLPAARRPARDRAADPRLQHELRPDPACQSYPHARSKIGGVTIPLDVRQAPLVSALSN